MQLIGRPWRTLAVSLAMSVLAVAPSFAPATPMMRVRAAVASGQSARVIMQFATTAERDAAFNRLLDRGAAVRAVDTEGGSGAGGVRQRRRVQRRDLQRHAGVPRRRRSRARRAAPARDTSARKRQAIGRARLDDHAPSRSGISVAIVDSGIAPHADLPLEPHPRLQGFRQRRPHAGRQLRPRHARRRHRRREAARTRTAPMRASRPTSTSWRCGCSATTARATPAT